MTGLVPVSALPVQASPGIPDCVAGDPAPRREGRARVHGRPERGPGEIREAPARRGPPQRTGRSFWDRCRCPHSPTYWVFAMCCSMRSTSAAATRPRRRSQPVSRSSRSPASSCGAGSPTRGFVGWESKTGSRVRRNTTSTSRCAWAPTSSIESPFVRRRASAPRTSTRTRRASPRSRARCWMRSSRALGRRIRNRILTRRNVRWRPAVAVGRMARPRHSGR